MSSSRHRTGETQDGVKGRILVVDDDRLVLATLTHGLAQAGYEVLDADNGDDAILIARQHRPDLALLDIRMEGLTGFDVAGYLRDYLQLPFMFLSAFADEATVAKVRELGALAYLVKPLDIHQIVPAVEAAFANRPVRGDALAPAAAAAPVATAADTAPTLDMLEAMAVGILMHRYSLTRAQAVSRLERMAAEQKISLSEQARRLVEALEQLSVGGSPPTR
ncbi:response regulator [Roseateles amylovorans]|uniref:Response regulator n=1 Tax=Roseateles amylovorans TaxID=2978473 RepID=A0ABY6B8E8_9BURK|nr:response regulator [Roseateles amylovorans]UXH79835.1 response regulator [Roseateles amylovorans]